MRRLTGVWLGRRRYEPVHRLQQRMQALRQQGAIPDSVLIVEHEPVITLGRGARAEHVLFSRQELEARGVDLIATGRGGDVTLHAPGQLVCYPIVDLAPDRRDVRRYVRDLEQVMCQLAADFGIASGAVPGLIGLWVDKTRPERWQGSDRAAVLAKLGAIGVRISRWVTMHGFAFNLTTDLRLFDLIVPCGVSVHGVTSVAELTGRAPEVQAVAPRVIELVCLALGAEHGGLEDRSHAPLSEGTLELTA
jgi:lipoyl(octanoyl) transferase